MSSYKKISRDLLQYSVFSGVFLGLSFCLVIFFFSIELRVYEMENNQTIDYIQKQISSLGAILDREVSMLIEKWIGATVDSLSKC